MRFISFSLFDISFILSLQTQNWKMDRET